MSPFLLLQLYVDNFSIYIVYEKWRKVNKKVCVIVVTHTF